MSLKIVVPRSGSQLERVIAAGSGIVMRASRSRGVVIDYEGNLYGAGDLATFAQRLYHAAGRAQADYPTVARMWLGGTEELVVVGTYDVSSWQAHLLTDSEAREALRRWVPEEFAD